MVSWIDRTIGSLLLAVRIGTIASGVSAPQVVQAECRQLQTPSAGVGESAVTPANRPVSLVSGGTIVTIVESGFGTVLQAPFIEARRAFAQVASRYSGEYLGLSRVGH